MISVYAQGQSFTLPGETVVQGLAPFSTVGGIVSRSVPFIFAFAGIGLLLMLLSAGFNFLTSAGDPKKLEMGKQRLTYAIVGFLVIFVAYWGVQLAGKIFGIAEIESVFK